MGSFRVTGIDATIGDWRWDGFAAANERSPLATARHLSLDGGPTWASGDATEPDWARIVLPVAHIARRGIEGAQLARRRAEGAMASALQHAFRDTGRLPTVGQLREEPREPECRIELHDLRIEFAWASGDRITVTGRDTLPRITGDGATPTMIAAARFAHRLAWREAYAALLDASARIGAHVPTREQTLETAAFLDARHHG